MDFNISDNTPIAALTVGQLKELIPNIFNTQIQARENDSIPEVFGKKECSELTGFSINTLNKYTSERKIPHYKCGKKVLFKKSDILSWIFSNRIQTCEEFLEEKDKVFTSLKCK